MKSMIKKILFAVIFFQVIISCGFTPTLKLADQGQTRSKIYYEIENSSYKANETLRDFFRNADKNEAKYISYIKVNESEYAVNIASNGSVLEYKIEVLIEYRVVRTDNEKLIHNSQTRGFANYDVSSSEYSTNLVKNEALKTAILGAAQLMNIMVNSKIDE